MKAIFTGGSGKVIIKETAVPSVLPGTVVVKNHAVAINPTDWKSATRPTSGNIIGCDFAGVVEEVGEGVTNVKKGERVASFVRGCSDPENGAFAEYTRQEASLVWKIPAKTSFEEAAAMGGIGPHTAVQSLFLRLGLPWPTTPTSTPFPVLIWAGATSVGMYAIQLAKAAGATVVTTASPSNEALLKSFGADAVFSYSDPETPAKIRSQFPGISVGLDNFAEQGSTKLAAKSFGDEGGKVAVLLGVKKEGDDWPEKVEIVQTLVYNVLPQGSEDRPAIEKWCQDVPGLIESGKLKSNPLKLGKGLEEILDGLEYSKAGKVKAQKLVYTLV